jgi:phosphorylase/glycogen(starch) synthase
MMDNQFIKPDFVFETSWEVCNKVGGIHTVISTKALTMVNEWQDRVIMIGPDVWKGSGEHPEFAEDKDLYASWRNYAASCGLRIKVGRWKIIGNPVVVLVDFTPFFSKKDEILSDLWVKYKVDSLTGGWDYIEPALFGYAAGLVIETFYHHHLTFSDKIVAQFHEWMTGTGILYLEDKVPQVGTIFTTHATVVGRAVAGNGLPLYSKFYSFDADKEATDFNVVAKHSLEKMSAHTADSFTTVSEITGRECEHFLGKEVDLVTPNGFEDFFVPDTVFYQEKRALARKKLLSVASTLCGEQLPEDSLLVIKSGRYEFHNKGIDIFIDALGQLDHSPANDKQIVAFIFIPGYQTGPRQELADALQQGRIGIDTHDKLLTHNLHGIEHDAIYNRLLQNHLNNEKDNKVKVVYAPVYLDGMDGIFDQSYYDMLTGFDFSVFPSYYEPWGYTPLEAIAFHIPTVITDLSGFGLMMQKPDMHIGEGIVVIKRDDFNDIEAANNIAALVTEYSKLTNKQIDKAREGAFQLSKLYLWKNLIVHYRKAFTVALEKTALRSHMFQHKQRVESIVSYQQIQSPEVTPPIWRKIYVESQLPEALIPLNAIAKNLWWTWHDEAEELFAMIDPDLWEEYTHNPIQLISSLNYTQIRRLEKNKAFLDKLTEVNDAFHKYMTSPHSKDPQVAYLCMEYGLDTNLKIYSGGLGILAGDYLKEASDQGYNMIGVGLLYRKGFFRQKISAHGEQIDEYDIHKFTSLPLQPMYDKDKEWMMVSMSFPGRTLHAKIWKLEVGRVPLYLLDTDIPENTPEDKTITAQLYGGDWENRLKQEFLLGVGGVRMLELLGYKPDVFHYNEGHAAFAGLERLRILIQNGNVTFDEAIEVVRSNSLFTTHTPVAAGHDMFSEDLVRIYFSHYADQLNISWKRLMGLGRANENDQQEKFSVSFLAARVCQEINGVSKLHGIVSRRIFSALWPGIPQDEYHIGSVTNGVHHPSWTAHEWKALYEKAPGDEGKEDQSENYDYKQIQHVPDATLWRLHTKYKHELIDEVKRRIRVDNFMPYQVQARLIQQLSNFNEDTLVFGFAKRIVKYKRSLLLFSDRERLLSIIRNAKCPMLFLFSGKAHPNDFEAKALVKGLVDISKDPEFEGKVIFIQNYDIDIAKYLTRGVDVWLNTPDLEMEASGTSGMKAMLNGALNLSVRDGWWAEAYRPDAGWAIGGTERESNPDIQYEMDAESIYRNLEEHVLPTYMDRDKDGIPTQWVAMMKTAIEELVPVYSMRRMLIEYKDKYYLKLGARNKQLRENHYEAARKLAEWKARITHAWPQVQVVSMDIFDSANKPFPVGDELKPNITIEVDGVDAADVGVEIVFFDKRLPDAAFGEIIFSKEMTPVRTKDRLVTYECKIPITISGVFEYAFKIYPANPMLPHKLDFPLYKWV